MVNGTDDPRLFRPFLDVTDMVMCCSASLSLAEVNREAAKSQLRFPLVCDPRATLAEHVVVVEYAASSARFGPFVDNILGMNWRLDTGKLVRIGERVIKSATGYDLMRFLLHSDGRYGQATDYVVRLRPLGGEKLQFTFAGPEHAIAAACTELRLSPWGHWLDAIDLWVGTQTQKLLRIEIDCVPGEADLFDSFVDKMKSAHGLSSTESIEPREPGLPALSIKATRVSATRIARDLVEKYGGLARVLCLNGVVFYYPPADRRQLPGDFIAELIAECEAEGGHVKGSLAPVQPLRGDESKWSNELAAAWNQL